MPKGEESSASTKTKALKKNSFPNAGVEKKNGRYESEHSSTPSQQDVITTHHFKNSHNFKAPKDTAKSSESKKDSQRKQGRSKVKNTPLTGHSITNVNAKTQEPVRKVSKKKSHQSLNVSQLPQEDFPPLSSIPSPPKNGATPEGMATQSSQPHVPTPPSPKSTLRPPPGLLPPPGFSYDETNTHPIMSPLKSAQLSSPVKTTPLLDRAHGNDFSESSLFDLQQRDSSQSTPPLHDLLFGARNEENLFQSSPTELSSNNNSVHDTPVRALSDSSVRFSSLRTSTLTPPVLESMSTDTPDDVQILLGTNNNFNVTNFLDGLLNDSTQPQQRSDLMSETPALSAEPLIHFNTSAVPLDPWNSSSELSRNNPLAAVIGKISNAESIDDDYNQDTLIAGIPLNSNTPSLLSPSFQNVGSFAETAYASFVSERNDEDEADSFLEPDSFYNQLLGED